MNYITDITTKSNTYITTDLKKGVKTCCSTDTIIISSSPYNPCYMYHCLTPYNIGLASTCVVTPFHI